MLQHNLDIRPPEDELAQYPLVRALAENQAITAAFDRYEAQAKKNKATYRFWGGLSVWMIAFGALYTIFWMTFGVEWQALSVVVLIFGVSALVIQAALWRLDSKNAWLKARFAAEQLRSIKFQAFDLAIEAGDPARLADLVTDYTRRRLVELSSKLNLRLAALKDFSPDEALKLGAHQGAPVNPELYAQARALYRSRRLNFQIDFAADEAESIESAHRPGKAITDYFYITGALLVVAAIVMKVLEFGHPHDGLTSSIARVIEFSSVSVFVVGAALATLEHAGLGEASVHRYRNYAADLSRVRADVDATHASLREEITRAEMLALRELEDFCGQALLISYRM